VSPYFFTIGEFIDRFLVSNDRLGLIRGLVDYRQEIYSLGIRQGVQITGGSFLTNCEKFRRRPSTDIGVLNFMLPPANIGRDELGIITRSINTNLLDNAAKKKFGLDCYFTGPRFNNFENWVGRLLRSSLIYSQNEREVTGLIGPVAVEFNYLRSRDETVLLNTKASSLMFT
jgi:hypothetical protein